MAEVLITFKVMPKDADTEIDALIEDIKGTKIAKLNDLEKIPVGFGLVSVSPSFITSDDEGGADKIESEIRNISSVGSTEVVEITRLL